MSDEASNPIDRKALNAVPAGIIRRAAAMIYDGLLLFSVTFVATGLALFFTGGESIPAGSLPFRAYLLIVAFLFFGWFWTHGGQTLGMRAWRLRTERLDGGRMGWGDAVRRYLCGLGLLMPLLVGLLLQPGQAARTVVVVLGLIPPLVALLWIHRNAEGLAWHDRASRTRVLYVPRAPFS